MYKVTKDGKVGVVGSDGKRYWHRSMMQSTYFMKVGQSLSIVPRMVGKLKVCFLRMGL